MKRMQWIDAPPSLSVGDIAPDFTLPSAEGQPLRLYECLNQGWVVLFFYPKDNTPGCTTEVCTFRDHYQAFQEAGAQVIGISADSPMSHQRFSENHRLPFPLLTDTDNSIRNAYGVPKTLGLLPGRVTFVIAPDHTIRLAFSSQFNAKAHTEKALQLLRQQTLNPER
jgi:peroxiredoxin Q/BCP